ncbi:MAG: hypothetical protein A3J55_04475 [Candidatus Ryanbacteria bacterium RIFCSPHIGHO2_02_FULL_45_17b]|nr:MAG: hypothetical protein A3J55_04475 [Candidatus Ryanbacteria bacterium RIFCSPHIGHO2_02_FULL_45_17b]
MICAKCDKDQKLSNYYHRFVILSNLGVIIYADKEGGIYIIPASEEVRKQMQDTESGMEKDETVSVPSMNVMDVWGSEERRKKMPSFHTWQNLVEKSQQEERAATERAAAREVFGSQNNT